MSLGNNEVQEIDQDRSSGAKEADILYIIKHIKFEVVSRFTKKMGADEDKDYKQAHKIACQEERKYFPEGFEELNKIIKANPNDWLGDNFKGGRIIVSKLVPEHLRKEVAFHEYVERREIDKIEPNNKH